MTEKLSDEEIIKKQQRLCGWSWYRLPAVPAPGVAAPTGWGFVAGDGGWFFRPATVSAQLSWF